MQRKQESCIEKHNEKYQHFCDFAIDFLLCREGEIAATYSRCRAGLKDKPDVGIADLLAARSAFVPGS